MWFYSNLIHPYLSGAKGDELCFCGTQAGSEAMRCDGCSADRLTYSRLAFSGACGAVALGVAV